MLGASPSLGQLTNVQWVESLSLDAVPDDNSFQTGVSSSTPEPLANSLSGSGYSISGSVTFASPGAPNATSHVVASYQSGLTFLGGTAYCRIDFQFAVRQTSNPPVSVSLVPVNVQVQGTAAANDDMFVNVFSSANFSTSQGPLGSWLAQVDNTQGNASDSFSENAQFMLAADNVVMGDLTASVNISTEILQANTTASGTAWVDPIIQVSGEAIPGGGGATFKDHFEIEFADGYWALGAIPVQPTTWGKIKRLYER